MRALNTNRHLMLIEGIDYMITLTWACSRHGNDRILNKCIGDDTKAAARQIPNCIRKTKKRSVERGYLSHCWNSMKKNSFPTQNLTKIGKSAAELWLKTILKTAAAVEFEKKFSYLVIWLSSSSKRTIVYHISSKSMIFCWDMAMAI